MDGGFSDNLLILDDDTITVSPFSGESDICPQDLFEPFVQINWVNTSIAVTPANIYRLSTVLFPPHPEVMSKMCQQGFDDALRFLQRNNIISCLRCVAIQSSFTVTESNGKENAIVSDDLVSVEPHEYDGCSGCERRRDEALFDSLPDPVARAIQDACDQVDKGVINWIFKHKPVKLISFLTIPYVLPFDITIVVLMKLWRQLPSIKKEINNSFSHLMSLTNAILSKVESKRHFYSANFSCQLAVTEYDYSAGSGKQVINSVSSVTPKSSSSPLIERKQSVLMERKPSVRMPSKPLERSQTFCTGRRSGVINRPNIPIRRQPSHDTVDAMALQKERSSLHRKSYAGSEFILSRENRRMSVADAYAAQAPERVISKVNFGFTVDLSGSKPVSASRSMHSLHSRSGENLFVNRDDINENDDDELMMNCDDQSANQPPDVIETLKHLTSEDHSENNHHSSGEISALNIANRALNWEKDHNDQESCPDNSGSTFNQILEDAIHQDPLMAFYYVDENNQVKMTEIFAAAPNLDEEANQNTLKLQSNW